MSLQLHIKIVDFGHMVRTRELLVGKHLEMKERMVIAIVFSEIDIIEDGKILARVLMLALAYSDNAHFRPINEG